MRTLNRNLPPIEAGQFSMVPRNDVPRSTFRTVHGHKTTFNAGELVPVHVDEVLPGDVHRGSMTVFGRLATPIFPIMDNLTLESFFFFVPCRLVWSNWKKFMGEQVNPADSISYTLPQVVSPVDGFAVASVYDFLGLPTVGQLTATRTVSVNALPLRCLNLIWNEWFRDENLQNSLPVNTGDGPDANTDYTLQARGKRHDYFTSALPWPLKGGVQVPLPLAGEATVKTKSSSLISSGTNYGLQFRVVGTNAAAASGQAGIGASVGAFGRNATAFTVVDALYPDNLYADLSTATGATINAMRLAVTTQQFLERDARGGTRYTELLRNHFGVLPEDSRVQRPEYIGGGKSRVETSAIPQTSAQVGAGPTVGVLGGTSTVAGTHHFSYHAAEHGYIIGFVSVQADLSYQQGLHRMWTRSTRYDFYWPVFAHLGEQVVRNDEIFVTGNPASDTGVFGYQERWAEYRYRQSKITGMFRSTSAGTIDPWHLAQKFVSLPALSSAFIVDNPPMQRVVAAGTNANNQEILFDSVFHIACTRPIPMFSVPGLTRF